MSISAKPPPLVIPTQEEKMDEFRRELLSSVYQLWQRVGIQLAVTGKVGLYNTDPVDQAAALTAAIGGAINTGDATTDTEIANIRTRLGQVEAMLDSSTGIGVSE